MGQRVRRSTAGIATGLAGVLLLSACGSGRKPRRTRRPLPLPPPASASASPSAEPTETVTPTETATPSPSDSADEPAAEADPDRGSESFRRAGSGRDSCPGGRRAGPLRRGVGRGPGPGSVPQGKATAAVDGLNVDYAQQAAGSAQSYIDMTGFSRSGLVDQLVYEGYTPDQAESGVSSLSVDYSEQAGRSAQSYLDLMPMSRAELVDQLIYEGYTPEEAAAGADSAGL